MSNKDSFSPGTRVWIYLCHPSGNDFDQVANRQESAIRGLCADQDWLVSRLFRDRWEPVQGNDNREAFWQMIYLARQKPRPADLLIIWSSLQFYQQSQLSAQIYFAELRANGWGIMCMQNDFPPELPAYLFKAFVAYRDEQKQNDLRYSTLKGLRFIVVNGCVPVGRIARGYRAINIQIGTHKDKNEPRMGRKPIIDPVTAPLVVCAFMMKAQGMQQSAISAATGLYGPKSSSWNHLFANRVYVGEYVFQGEIYNDVYPPLISRGLFDEVQKLIVPKPRK